MTTLQALGEALNPDLFWEYRNVLLSGFSYNLLIFALSAVGATVIGMLIGIARLSSNWAVRATATSYAEIFRNTPEYVLLVWAYYVLPIIIGRITGTNVRFDPITVAVASLAVAYSGYFSETFRAGILAVPKANIEAGMSVGMSGWMILRRLVIPQAVRRMLPESLNQYISLFKSTSIVSLIAIEDLMYRVSMITMEESRPLPLYTWAAIVFCTAIVLLTQVADRLSARWRRAGLA
ncbi:amino acid ABC transporter permease [Aquabacter sp. CN5-332]|uniref:amino acid ABC transporter permease n=1 Tax=Aquabacter sp. CN5-332 TaxID=3156608 RepID=UPI0032B61FC9